MAKMTQERREAVRAAQELRALYLRTHTNWLACLVKRKGPEEERRAARLMRETGDAFAVACATAQVTQPDLLDMRNAALKGLTPAVRAKLAPHIKAGLSGRARQWWIDEGLTLDEQMAADRLSGRATEFGKDALSANRVPTYTLAQVAKRLKLDTATLGDYADRCDVPRARMTMEQAKRIVARIKADRAPKPVAKRYPLKAVARKLGVTHRVAVLTCGELGIAYAHGVTLKDAKRMRDILNAG